MREDSKKNRGERKPDLKNKNNSEGSINFCENRVKKKMGEKENSQPYFFFFWKCVLGWVSVLR